MNQDNLNQNQNPQRGGGGRGGGRRPFRGRGGGGGHGRGHQQTSNGNDRPRNNYHNNGGSRNNENNRGGHRGRGRNNDHENQRNGTKPFSDEVASYGISYSKIEEICKLMDSKKILPGSSDLMTAVQAESFTKRLDCMWPQLDKKVNFMRVIVATAATNQADLMNLTYKFVADILKSKLIPTLVEELICPMPYDPSMQRPLNLQLAGYLIKFLLQGFVLNPSNMDMHLPKVENVISVLLKLDDGVVPEDTLQQVERLGIALKDRHEAKAAQRQQTANPRKRQNADFEGSEGEPPMNFRELSVVPTPDDISYAYRPYLRAAKKKGKYDSDEHYLDVQFRLLREDLIRPLREGIAQYQKGGSRQTDLKVYQEVELGASTMHKQTGELISYASIKTKRPIRFDKCLKYGSLVCLSSDDFQTVFLFATVIDRDEKALFKKEVGLKFEEMSKVNTKWKYKMVESPAFFEAYKHVMKALQAHPLGDAVPFSRYLVDVNVETGLPAYMEEKQIDFDHLIKDEFKQYFDNTEFFVDEIQHRLSPEVCGMDESQFNALVYALTTDLAIIQGPPGTGKTYMGLQLAQLLFENWNAWNPKNDERPMLIVCYTNHALDQFLEGISKFMEEGIIRVGGRCKNVQIAEFNLSKKRQWDNPILRTQFFKKRDEIGKLQKEMEEKSAVLKQLEARFVNPNAMMPVLTNSETPYFQSSRDLIYKVSTSSSELWMFKWLTQTTKNFQNFNLNDISIIRQLMAWGVAEIKAKNALALTYNNNEYLDAFGLYTRINSRQYRNLPDNRFIRGAENWPPINVIDEVIKMGYNEAVALELLVNNTLAQILLESNRTKTANPTKELAKVSLPTTTTETEPTIEEEMEAIDFQNADDDNRMIDDTNVLDEFIVQEASSKSKKDSKNNPQHWFNPDVLPQFLEFITVAPPMSEEEANTVENVWEIPLQNRWRLYQYWIEKIRDRINNDLQGLEEKYSENVKLLTELRSLADVSILKSAKVVGMTTTGAAKHQSTLRALRPRILIVEEAAEVLEAHLVASLTEACQHLILIGDHKQLRPNPAVYELAIKYNLEISLFERLINNSYPYRMLENQHRMCPIISRTLMPHFYENLKDDPSVNDRNAVKGVTKNLRFINHSYSEIHEKEFKSHRNPYEAEYAVALARYFLQQNYKAEDITILSAYLDQHRFLRGKADQVLGKGHGINIQSVDNYQGEECNIIILSLVRSNNPDNKIGFLSTANRVCVALSRAKEGLYVICNLDFLADNCDLWRRIKISAVEAGAVSNELIVKCQPHGKEQTITTFKDFEAKCREGGCDIPCNFRLNCGHKCPKPCHADDMDHEKYKCQKPCEKKCKADTHRCKKDCWQDCGDCKIMVLKKLPCGHQKMDFCYLGPEDIRCGEACDKNLPCGHGCKNRCGNRCTEICKELVSREIPTCNHVIQMPCSANANAVKCDAKVEKEWPRCKHVTVAKCSDDVIKMPCKKPCGAILPDCGHKCKGTCGECRNGRIHVRCTENCKKILICGHECESKCSAVCPPCVKACETACGHSQCGNLPINGEKKKTRKILQQKKNKGGRTCGENCPPCMEQCFNQCEHRQCELVCGEPCTVLPCTEACQKLLPCDPRRKKKNIDDENYIPHLCIGVCGEDCPKICKICDPEKFEEVKEIFFGTEEDENARFIQLKDCGHFIEANSMDQYIQSLLPDPQNGEETSTEIVKINCPKCKTPICRSKRYISLLNQRAIDMENIKLIIRGLTHQEKNKEQEKFEAEVVEAFEKIDTIKVIGNAEEVTWLKKVLKTPHKHLMTKSWFASSRNILNIIKLLTKYEERAEEKVSPFNIKVNQMQGKPIFQELLRKQEVEDFFGFIRKELIYLIGRIDPRNISETTVQQIALETKRFGFLVEFFSYLARAASNAMDLPSNVEYEVNQIFRRINGPKIFDEKRETQLSDQLTNLSKIYPVSDFGISPQERIEIIEALDGHVTRWYKCPNGHYYGIGNCGQAVETSKCPECKATIGGSSHRIRNDNQDAQGEMLNGTGQVARPLVNGFAVVEFD